MNESTTPGVGRGATCAIHPDQPAKGVCRRCGSFMCDACTDDSAPNLCPTCREKVSTFPLSRDAWTFDGLLSLAWERFKPNWLNLSLAAFIMIVVSFLIGMVGNVVQLSGGSPIASAVTSVVSTIVQSVVEGIFTMGLLRMCFDAYEGRPADIGKLFSQTDKLGRYIILFFVIFFLVAIPLAVYVGILVAIAMAVGGGSLSEHADLTAVVFGAGALLAVVPLIYLTLPLVFAPMELVYADTGAMDALRNAYVIGRGKRLATLGVGLVAGLIAAVSVCALCVGFFPGVAFYQLVLAGLYLTFRSGAPLPVRGT